MMRSDVRFFRCVGGKYRCRVVECSKMGLEERVDTEVRLASTKLSTTLAEPVMMTNPPGKRDLTASRDFTVHS